MGTRIDGRAAHELRAIEFSLNFIKHPEGSVLISCGETKVLCNVTIEDSMPAWITQSNKNHGWVTGEYAMLPRATHTRVFRENKGPRGRTQEIQRLVGRSLRAAINLDLLGPRSCIVDCDVLQADGGTRTAAITGGYVALCLALNTLIQNGTIPAEVIKNPVAAISVGIRNGEPLLDLCYEEDSTADTDMNVVMAGQENFIELQGTAEQKAFNKKELDSLLQLAQSGIHTLFQLQQTALQTVL